MNIEILNIPKIEDYRGNIAIIEKEVLPFEIKRVYYLYDVPSSAKRGGHAHKDQLELLIALSGSFDVVVKDGKSTQTITLNKPDKGLLIKTNVWRELENFSSGSVCLVVVSDVFNEDDYIREYNDYLEYLKQVGEYDLEVEALNLQTETIETSILKMGKGGESAFGDDSILEKVRANILKKPFKPLSTPFLS